jgi:hypothetical protein
MLRRSNLHSISVEYKTHNWLYSEGLLSIVGMYQCNARNSIIIMITGKRDYSAFEVETECSNAVSKTGCCLFSTLFVADTYCCNTADLT